MAIDTKLKRFSVINLGMPTRGIVPPPDGSVDPEDRQVYAGLYSGIAFQNEGYSPPTFLGQAPIALYQHEAMTPVNLAAAFSIVLAAAPATYVVVSGDPPSGVTVATNGTLSGTPGNSGTFLFVVRATDRQSGYVDSDPIEITVTRNPATPAKGTLYKGFTINRFGIGF